MYPLFLEGVPKVSRVVDEEPFVHVKLALRRRLAGDDSYNISVVIAISSVSQAYRHHKWRETYGESGTVICTHSRS